MAPVTDPREIKTAIVEVYEPKTQAIHETGLIPEPTKKEIGFKQERFRLTKKQDEELKKLFAEKSKEEIEKYLAVNWSFRDLMKAKYALEKYTPGNLFELTGDEPPPDGVLVMNYRAEGSPNAPMQRARRTTRVRNR